jgi:uncharacterized protein YndB with AHSA1/START domain
MDKSIIATADVTIASSPQVVWQALTDPAVVKEYFFGVQVESTWQEGSPITYHGEWEGKKFEDKGMVARCVPNELLESTYWTASFGEDKPENYVLVRYEITEVDGGTKVTVTQEGNKDQKGADHSSQNWQMVLNGMKTLLETSKPS